MNKIYWQLVFNLIVFAAAGFAVQTYFDIPDFSFGLRVNAMVWVLYGISMERLWQKYQSAKAANHD